MFSGCEPWCMYVLLDSIIKDSMAFNIGQSYDSKTIHMYKIVCDWDDGCIGAQSSGVSVG